MSRPAGYSVCHKREVPEDAIAWWKEVPEDASFFRGYDGYHGNEVYRMEFSLNGEVHARHFAVDNMNRPSWAVGDVR